MLKIKDNIDLNILKKYGFKYDEKNCKYTRSVPTYQEQYDWTGFDVFIENGNFEELNGYWGDQLSRQITIYGATYDHDEYFGVVHNIDLDTLFDLIQAGVVEKVR